MKLWNNYVKEMKIASRGFYFYVEFFVAFVMLSVLLFVVPAESTNVSEEIIFADMTDAQFTAMMEITAGDQYAEQMEDAVFTVKPTTLNYTNLDAGLEISHTFADESDITVLQYYIYDGLTGEHTATQYFVDSFDSMLRIAYGEKITGAKIWYGADGLDYYQCVLFGYETSRYQNILLASHGTVDTTALLAEMETAEANTVTLSKIELLNNRENFIPPLLVMLNAMMGMMIIVAYLSVDKSEGVIKALCVAPVYIGNYLASKTLVVITTVLLSNSIIAIPIMGAQPNYLLFYLASIAMCVLSCGIGMLLSTFFADLKSAFGAILFLCIVLLLPILTYLFPAFHPSWMDFLPTYIMLMAMKETLLSAPDVGYVLLCVLGMLVVSAVLYGVSFKRYQKILSVGGGA